jgi:hypothetical protein
MPNRLCDRRSTASKRLAPAALLRKYAVGAGATARDAARFERQLTRDDAHIPRHQASGRLATNVAHRRLQFRTNQHTLTNHDR